MEWRRHSTIRHGLKSHLRALLTAERYTNNFQESLILLKDLLCWDYEDITNLKLNARKQSVVILNININHKGCRENI